MSNDKYINVNTKPLYPLKIQDGSLMLEKEPGSKNLNIKDLSTGKIIYIDPDTGDNNLNINFDTVYTYIDKEIEEVNTTITALDTKVDTKVEELDEKIDTNDTDINTKLNQEVQRLEALINSITTNNTFYLGEIRNFPHTLNMYGPTSFSIIYIPNSYPMYNNPDTNIFKHVMRFRYYQNTVWFNPIDSYVQQLTFSKVLPDGKYEYNNVTLQSDDYSPFGIQYKFLTYSFSSFTYGNIKNMIARAGLETGSMEEINGKNHYIIVPLPDHTHTLGSPFNDRTDYNKHICRWGVNENAGNSGNGVRYLFNPQKSSGTYSGDFRTCGELKTWWAQETQTPALKGDTAEALIKNPAYSFNSQTSIALKSGLTSISAALDWLKDYYRNRVITRFEVSLTGPAASPALTNFN